jgi:hypothetical protein
MAFIGIYKEAILCFLNSILLDNKSFLAEAFYIKKLSLDYGLNQGFSTF